MSDHSNLPSVSTIKDYSGTDEEYLNLITGTKAKPATTRHLENLPIVEIAEALKVRVLPFQPGTDEYRRAFLADRSRCPFCDHSTSDIIELAQHIKGHDEITNFLSSCARAAQRYESLQERRAQIEANSRRLAVELKELDEDINAFDTKALARRQAQASEFTRLLVELSVY